ncbi:hypothetical protein VHEMI05543 [[Torrubiella] hemipterigena]|uniref:GST C-terminal domain-containing protein n=1 Tax=[Torrubiella] hemipterigena TaxID=1531966 RepID=A0A0A1TJ27_9HYPO|nr:hypothetical protein VHEMI05543 [[Torrubiella] hemipterigena]
MSKGLIYHKDGSFTRPDTDYRSFISREPGAEFPPEAGRYALYISPGCPWAHRTMIMRKLKGLEDIIELIQVHPYLGQDGWYFSGEMGSPPEDPLHPGFTTLKQLYLSNDPNFSGRYTVPLLWDKKTDRPVNNESSELIVMFATEFDGLIPEHLRESSKPDGGLYPANLKAEIDAINKTVYDTLNNGVYKVGFARSQESYEENIGPLFETLRELDTWLSKTPYLVGNGLTLADIRLYPTIARFDAAYNTAMLCTLDTIRGGNYPNLHRWLRRLFWNADKHGNAFYDTTAPWLHYYPGGYADSRRRIVFNADIPLIIPKAPDVEILIPKLEG